MSAQKERGATPNKSNNKNHVEVRKITKNKKLKTAKQQQAAKME